MDFELRPSASLVKNTEEQNVRKLDLFPFSGEGGSSLCGSVGNK
jgi:hypothetical protein